MPFEMVGFNWNKNKYEWVYKQPAQPNYSHDQTPHVSLVPTSSIKPYPTHGGSWKTYCFARGPGHCFIPTCCICICTIILFIGSIVLIVIGSMEINNPSFTKDCGFSSHACDEDDYWMNKCESCGCTECTMSFCGECSGYDTSQGVAFIVIGVIIALLGCCSIRMIKWGWKAGE